MRIPFIIIPLLLSAAASAIDVTNLPVSTTSSTNLRLIGFEAESGPVKQMSGALLKSVLVAPSVTNATNNLLVTVKTGNVTGATNFWGVLAATNFANSTINSNRFDANTLAALQAGGSSGGAWAGSNSATPLRIVGSGSAVVTSNAGTYTVSVSGTGGDVTTDQLNTASNTVRAAAQPTNSALTSLSTGIGSGLTNLPLGPLNNWWFDSGQSNATYEAWATALFGLIFADEDGFTRFVTGQTEEATNSVTGPLWAGSIVVSNSASLPASTAAALTASDSAGLKLVVLDTNHNLRTLSTGDTPTVNLGTAKLQGTFLGDGAGLTNLPGGGEVSTAQLNSASNAVHAAKQPTNSSLTLASGQTILTNGYAANVGIGTNNPQTILHTRATPGSTNRYIVRFDTSDGVRAGSIDTNGAFVVTAGISYGNTVAFGNDRSVFYTPANGYWAMSDPNQNYTNINGLIFGRNSLTDTNIPMLKKLAHGTPSSPTGLLISDAANTNGAVLELKSLPSLYTAAGTASGTDVVRLYGTSNTSPVLNVVGGLTPTGVITGNGSGLTNLQTSSLSGLPWDTNKTYMLIEGDSLSTPPKWPSVFTSVFGWTNFAFFTNAAHSGDNWLTISNNWATEIAPRCPQAGTNGILLLWGGANDLGTTHADQVVTSMSNVWFWAKQSNLTLVAFTMMPRGDWDGDKMQTNLFFINEWIYQSTNWDYLVDTFSMFPNPYDSRYFDVDTIHLTAAGYYRLAQEVDRILRGPKRQRFMPGSQYGTNQTWFDPKTYQSLVRMNWNGVALTAAGTVQATNFAGNGTLLTNIPSSALANAPIFGAQLVSDFYGTPEWIDPGERMYFSEPFKQNPSGVIFPSCPAANSGNGGFSTLAARTALAVAVPLESFANSIGSWLGVVRLSITNHGSSYASLFWSASAGSTGTNIVLRTNTTFDAVVMFEGIGSAASDVSLTNHGSCLGFVDTGATGPYSTYNAFVGFAIYGRTNSSLQCVCKDSTGITNGFLGWTPITNTPLRLSFVANTNGPWVKFYTNGVACWTNTTFIPTVALMPEIYVRQSASNTAGVNFTNALDIDMLKVKE